MPTHTLGSHRRRTKTGAPPIEKREAEGITKQARLRGRSHMASPSHFVVTEPGLPESSYLHPTLPSDASCFGIREDTLLGTDPVRSRAHATE